MKSSLPVRGLTSRDRPEEKARYGATIAKDIEIWPPRLAGRRAPLSSRDDPASQGVQAGRPALQPVREPT